MKIKDILVEFATSMGSSDVASMPTGGSGANVGTLFGGSYQQKAPSKPKKKKKSPSESVIRR